MKKTFIPCSLPIQILDQKSGEISNLYDYVVNRGGRDAIGVVIESIDGTEMVYVDGQNGPVASMLPGQREDNEMLKGLYRGWAWPKLPLPLIVKVGKKEEHFIAWVDFSGRLCRSKSLSYVKGKIKGLSKFSDVIVEYHLEE